MDAPPEKTAFQNDTFRSVGMPVLFFVGFAFFIWSLGQYLWRTAEEGVKTVSAGIKPAVAGASSQGGADAPQSSAPFVPTESEAPAEPEGPGTVSIMASEPPKTQIVREWKMRGTIYDLITLSPVPSAQLTFTDNDTNARALIQADSRGRYRAILPSLAGRGYVVTLAKPGYAKSYLDPGTEGVASMPLERRKEIVKELSSLISEPSTIEPNSGAPLVTNFYIAPQ
ncbi:MAG: carboxypeptidase-like regulatory domain-containing protein [Elusimicrobiota bacterium]